MRVVLIHPDLGIGGAERLVIDAALAMKQNGHQVQFVTNHYRKEHSFIETDEFAIKTVDIFPRSVFGVGKALCAYIRMCLAALYVCLYTSPDLIFCDSISACLIVFRFFRLIGRFDAPILFYCHFPDQLLTDRNSFAKKIYRFFIDWFEAWTMSMADKICVNSQFTRGVVENTFPRLCGRHLHILYPTVNTNFMDNASSISLDVIPSTSKHIFVSINRYERKKNISIALDAFAALKGLLSPDEYQECFLIIAGGFDVLNEENRQHYVELKNHAAELQLNPDQITFLKSPGDEEKLELFRRATAVLYTPCNEHFGIVPVEAMYMRCCVIAANSGGPCETVIDGTTGFLVTPTAQAFAEKMAQLVKSSPNLAAEMGDAGHDHVKDKLSIREFAIQLECLMQSLV